MSRGPYRGRHQATRRALAPQVATGAVTCWRCGQLIEPGEAWDLGHDDRNPSIYRGPEHAGRCNRSAGGRKGRALQRQRRRLSMDLVGVGVLAVEVAADRGHTSICSACRLDGDRVQVELVAYLGGTATAVDRVVELHDRWTVQATVIDPMGGATNLRRPLCERSKVRLVAPDTAAVKVAYADFRDMAHRRELAVVANDVLSTAMQYLTERTLGGQPVFDRRGAPVDVAPAVAAMLAVWGLLTAGRTADPQVYIL
jgi:hypothetical protein